MNPFSSPNEQCHQSLSQRWSRFYLVAGVGCLIFSSLPWLGFGSYAFCLPYTDIFLPRLHLISRDSFPGADLLYSFLAAPLHLLGDTVPGVGYWVFFRGEGIVTARPFMIFVFWFLVGLFLVLRSWRLARRVPRIPQKPMENQ